LADIHEMKLELAVLLAAALGAGEVVSSALFLTLLVA